MREIESDGFITREEDLMKSERTAKPMTECGYPRCEECDKCVDGYCAVPMVVSKQIYLNTAERIVLLEENVSALEHLVYDEILGDGGDEAKLVSFKLSKELCKNPRVEIKE